MSAPRRLVEAHVHLASLGQSLGMPSLETCGSVAECLHLVRAWAADARAAATDRVPWSRRPRRGHAPARSDLPPIWLRAHSVRVEAWPEARWPSRTELDAAAGDGAAVVLMGFDHHSACANSPAMSAAALHPGQPVGRNGSVTDDGLLLEEAAYAAWAAAPEPTLGQWKEFVREGTEHLKALGFAEAHDMHAQPWLGRALGELARDRRLPIEVWLYAPADRIEEEAARRRDYESDLVRLAGGKVFADGTLNSRTALMLAPYADAPPERPRGRAMLSPDELDAFYRRAAGVGLPLAVHAIGDGAVRMVLDSIERTGPGRGTIGPQRIEHCELIDAADVGRFADLGVVCSVQPRHLLTDIEVLTRALPDRLDRVLPLRELMEAGCRPGELLVFGSDAPIVPAEPEVGVTAAVSRRRAKDEPPLAPSQAIDEAAAWRAYGGLPG